MQLQPVGKFILTQTNLRYRKSPRSSESHGNRFRSKQNAGIHLAVFTVDHGFMLWQNVLSLTTLSDRQTGRQAGRLAGRQADKQTDRHARTYAHIHTHTHSRARAHTHTHTHSHSALVGRRFGKYKNEWTGKIQIRTRGTFLAERKACVAIF